MIHGNTSATGRSERWGIAAINNDMVAWAKRQSATRILVKSNGFGTQLSHAA
jgi:hypothetical protein